MTAYEKIEALVHKFDDAVCCNDGTRERARVVDDAEAALLAAVKVLAEDAERYRWLKMTSKPSEACPLVESLVKARKAYEVLTAPWTDWDTVIDAARQPTVSAGDEHGKR